MLSFIPASNRFAFSPCADAGLNCPVAAAFRPVVYVVELRRRRPKWTFCLNLAAARESGLLGFSNFQGAWRSGFVRRCTVWEGGGDLALEAEILEFMKKSRNPAAFPTKKELLVAGRIDLVEAIVKQGGWLSLGWDLDEAAAVGGDEVSNDNGSLVGGGSEAIQDNANSSPESDALASRVSRTSSANSCHVTTSSGRSLETASADDMGIEGILNRLEKQRNMSFGPGLKERENSSHVFSNDGGEDWRPGIPDEVADLERSSQPMISPDNGQLNDLRHMLSQNISLSNFDDWKNSHKPEMWRTWSTQRAGLSGMEFEAGEIAFDESRTGGATNCLKDEIVSVTASAGETLDGNKELNSSGGEIRPNQILSRLQHLESELSSALHLLRSKRDEVVLQKGLEGSLENLQTLSDACEFQENEIMNAQDRLRSIRAKLAVLEGKMALAIIDAQKIAEEKQKKIDDAHKALHLLRTTCIVWPNSASEVLLAGSYDGWATQRKMERSSTGIFSLCLKLYPGRYEIKFVIDGTWRIDPLRPIVNNNGYENNLLIIT
ncbi:protein PTST homolog 2, chloroplastic [Malania oleifera]|uniref:protein PTST homolog 2, chloroplastic n=1 Tax=Malania oleifera TaxID=397392 RepID=UPI0025ADF7AC|nr:protein PTST homolog 2, chloroplastic [Malania oleifera]XP_057949179.1 protein PTST homolog 2, chloroplastic [Malania oleifera]